jgi:signal peptide peptidase SppA
MEEQKLTKKEKLLEKLRIFFRKIWPSLRWVIIIALGVIIGGSILLFCIGGDEVVTGENEEEIFEYCNVTGINLHGDLYTYITSPNSEEVLEDYENAVASEYIIYKIDEANADPEIKAIILEVDSYGGIPVAGEEIADYIKRSTKPVIGYIRSSGISAAYWAISSAGRIFASKNSDVGGIGVTMSYLQNVRKNEKEGLEYIQLSSGKFKDAGDPDKAITSEERKLFMRDINILHENFIEAVSQNRDIPIEKVKEISDGSSVLGEEALRLGLIDEIGGYNEVRDYIKDKIGEEVIDCWE